MKKKLSLMLALALVLTTVFAFPSFAATETKITIVHTNDTHGNVKDDGSSVIGFAKLAGYVQELKKNNNVLVVDGGDMFQGLPFANLENGKSVINIVNQVGYDAMTVGNHEFDFGSDNMMEIHSAINFPMISANILKDGKQAFEGSMIKEVGGIKIGIFGISTPETAFKTHPDNVVGYEFTDIIESSKTEVAKLKADGAQVIVMLGHLGLYEGDYTSDLVAQAVEGIDIIVDGHSHTKLTEGLMVNDTLIVSAETALKSVGIVELTVVDGKVTEKTASLLTYKDFADVTPVQSIVDEIATVEAAQAPILGEVIGKTAVELVGTRGVVRTGESNLGQLATDAMIELTGADMAITNGGGIRASIAAGDITMKDMVTVFPFGNTVMVKEITGKDIVAALEHGTSDYPNEKGAFPHVAGITFTLNGFAPAGERITDVKIGGQKIELDKTYEVATNDFMATGGDGYTMFKAYPIKKEFNTLMDTLLDAVKSQGTVAGKLETRISVVNDAALRTFAEGQGFEVEFDGKTREITMTKEDVVIEMKIGSLEYKAVDADSKIEASLKVAPTIKNGKTVISGVEFNKIVAELAKPAA